MLEWWLVIVSESLPTGLIGAPLLRPLPLRYLVVPSGLRRSTFVHLTITRYLKPLPLMTLFAQAGFVRLRIAVKPTLNAVIMFAPDTLIMAALSTALLFRRICLPNWWASIASLKSLGAMDKCWNLGRPCVPTKSVCAISMNCAVV